ncbi:MAG: SGNH/GDSL hydrolase family protein [Deltaproteobacteria bacterium]|nr:SGNH/GDSL hydrolase family protein [Deltaproteobacteria bacterium]
MRTFLSRVILVLASTAVGLLACEIALRFTGYEGDDERINTVYYPALGTVRQDSWILDYRVDPKKQSRVSIRGQIIPLKKDPGEKRVIFIGDSGTEAPYLPVEKSYPLVFKRRLDRLDPGNRVRIINAGVWGMTTIDEYHFLKEELLVLKPDIVVLGLFMANDINFNLGHSAEQIRIRPTFDLIAYLKDRSVLIHYLYLRALALNNKYKLVRSDVLTEKSLIPIKLGLIDSYGFHMLNYPLGEVATYMKKSSRLIDYAFDVLRTVFHQFLRLGATHHFAFRVLLIPTPSAVAGRLAILHHPRILDDINESGTRISEADLDFTKPTRRVLMICRELKISCIDPTSRMQQIGMSVFFPQDEHLTELGHEAVAEQLLSH